MKFEILAEWDGSMAKHQQQVAKQHGKANIDMRAQNDYSANRSSADPSKLEISLKNSEDQASSFTEEKSISPEQHANELFNQQISEEKELMYFKGLLVLEKASTEDDVCITDDPESIFHRVPGRILSFVDGCPSKVTQVQIRTDPEDERLFFTTQPKFSSKSEQGRLTQSVHSDRIFQLIQTEGFKKDDMYDALDACNSRVAVIQRAISTYLKKYIQVMEYDPNMDDKEALSGLPPSKIDLA